MTSVLVEEFSRPAYLYHGTGRRIKGDTLRPRPQQTCTGHKGNFVFATHDRRSAYAYALQNGGVFFVGQSGGDVYCLIEDRERFYANPPNGAVYKAPAKKFKPVLWGPWVTGEWIAKQRVPIGQPEEQDITIEKVMEHGVRVFFMRPGLTREDWAEHFHATGRPPARIAIASALGRNLLTYENALHGPLPG